MAQGDPKLQKEYMENPPEVSKTIHESIQDNPTISYSLYDSLIKLGQSGIKLRDLPGFLKESYMANKDDLRLGAVASALNVLSNRALKGSPFRLDILGQYGGYRGKDLDIRLGRLDPGQTYGGKYYQDYDMYFGPNEELYRSHPEVGISIKKRF
jgi:hypothetical protein